MSYSPKVHYILEKDLDYEIKYETPPSSGISVGDTFGFPISDFEYNGKKYYAKYAITGGEIFYRGDNGAENGIYAESMVISESEYYCSICYVYAYYRFTAPSISFCVNCVNR